MATCVTILLSLSLHPMKSLSLACLLAAVVVSACGSGSNLVSVLPEATTSSQTSLLSEPIPAAQVDPESRQCQALESRLTRLTQNLLFPSECSTCDFAYVNFPDLTEIPTPEEFLTLLQGSGLAELEDEIEARSFDEEFDRIIRNLFGAPDPRSAFRFIRLRQGLERSLDDLVYYRVGTIEVHIFILGTTSTCGVSGLQTISVET